MLNSITADAYRHAYTQLAQGGEEPTDSQLAAFLGASLLDVRTTRAQMRAEA